MRESSRKYRDGKSEHTDPGTKNESDESTITLGAGAYRRTIECAGEKGRRDEVRREATYRQ